jgi:hypothetical protein
MQCIGNTSSGGRESLLDQQLIVSDSFQSASVNIIQHFPVVDERPYFKSYVLLNQIPGANVAAHGVKRYQASLGLLYIHNNWPFYSEAGPDRPLDYISNITSLIQVIFHVKPLLHP